MAFVLKDKMCKECICYSCRNHNTCIGCSDCVQLEGFETDCSFFVEQSPSMFMRNNEAWNGGEEKT